MRYYNLVEKETGEKLKDCEADLEKIQSINESLNYRFKIVEAESE